MTPRPRLLLTPTGKLLGFLAVFLLFAANNTGNNLLFLVVAGLVALLGVAAGMALLNGAGLEAAWEGEAEGFAGGEADLRLTVTEPGRRGRLHLAVEGPLAPVVPVAGDAAAGGAGRGGEAPDRPGPLGRGTAFGLDTGGTAVIPVRVWLARRGTFPIDGLKLVSEFPLGLVRVERPLPAAVAWAFPRPHPARVAGPAESPLASRPDVDDRSGDFWQLVPYQDGQDSRLINWSISARTGGEWVVANAVPREEPLRVWLDTGSLSAATIEPFLERVSALFLAARAHQTSLFAWLAPATGEPSWVAAREPAGCARLLRWLACLEPGPAAPPPASPEGAGQPVVRVGPDSFRPEGGGP